MQTLTAKQAILVGLLLLLGLVISLLAVLVVDPRVSRTSQRQTMETRPALGAEAGPA